MSRLRWAAVVVGLLFAGSLQAAPPALNYLFPPAIGRGETAMIEAFGTFAEWPVEVYVEGTGVSVKPAEKKGQLEVTVAADAEPGVRLLRIADSGGLSAARPLIVGTLPTVVEVEPNDAPDKPQLVAASSVVSGRLAKSGDVDNFRIPLKRGQNLVAAVEAHNVLGSPMDAILQIVTTDGFTLDQNDDARGIDPQIVFEAPADDEYLVRIVAFPETANSSIGFAGGAEFVYRLTLTTGPYIDYTLPLAVPAEQPTEVELGGWNLTDELRRQTLPAAGPEAAFVGVTHPELAGLLRLPVLDMPALVATGGTLAQPQTIPVPSSVSGRLFEERQPHVFQIQAAKGQNLRLRVDSYELGYPLDPVLRVLDESGKQLSEVDDVPGDARDASLSFRPPSDGTYRIEVADLHGRAGERFVYRLTTEPAAAEYRLKPSSDAFTIEVGKPLEIAVDVQRLDGFGEVVEVTAVDLPEGVTAEPVQSEAKGDSAKQVKLKLQADRPFAPARFRVVGRVADAETPAHYAYPKLRRETSSFWLVGVDGKAK